MRHRKGGLLDHAIDHERDGIPGMGPIVGKIVNNLKKYAARGDDFNTRGLTFNEAMAHTLYGTVSPRNRQRALEFIDPSKSVDEFLRENKKGVESVKAGRAHLKALLDKAKEATKREAENGND